MAPAWLTAIPLTMYGAVLTVMAPLMAVGVLPESKPSPPFTTSLGITWMVEVGGLAFAGLGIGLIVAARSLAARTHPARAAAATTTKPARTAGTGSLIREPYAPTSDLDCVTARSESDRHTITIS
ncbi:hypothetical protein ACIRBY_25140 [Streptomyces sp. NPDC096136]|uniref:hypothetical protein n=1 Tax=Streptomyces sp. NPDC096136 TaxID=3366076 RepID=UPI0038236F5F